jgi:PAS domain S-box-containing protein
MTMNEFSEDGNCIIIGALRDLTERNKAVAALREMEERFRLLAESINIVPYAFERGTIGSLDYIGPQVERMFGYPACDWLQPNFFWGRIHPDDVPAVLAQEKDFGQNRESYELEYRMVAANGRVLWVRDIVHLVDTGIAPKTGFGVLVDISESKQRDQKLAQAQKMMAIGQLTGGIAHDFNNLLTVIVGNAEVLVEGTADSRRLRKASELTLRSARLCADLVQQMLAFSRQQVLLPEAVNVDQLVSSMHELVKRSVGERVTIEIVSSPNTWMAFVDPSQLEDALLNLSANARDAMPYGGKLVIEVMNATIDEDDVGQGVDLPPGQYVRIAVSDTGSGMKPDILARAFEPFFTTKEVGKGTGLGLSMVFGFAKQSGGHAKIDSRESQGTTVTIFLPRAISMIALAVEKNVTNSEQFQIGKKILVVEDEELVRDFVVGQLIGLGYEVIEASNGTEAMKVLATGMAIDLLFSDVMMPGHIKGDELARQARRLRPHLKVLLTSGYTQDMIADNIGIDMSILSKPYSRQQFAEAIRTALDDAGSVGNVAVP